MLSTPIANIKNGITSKVIKLAFIPVKAHKANPMMTADMMYNIPTKARE